MTSVRDYIHNYLIHTHHCADDHELHFRVLSKLGYIPVITNDPASIKWDEASDWIGKQIGYDNFCRSQRHFWFGCEEHATLFALRWS